MATIIANYLPPPLQGPIDIPEPPPLCKKTDLRSQLNLVLLLLVFMTALVPIFGAKFFSGIPFLLFIPLAASLSLVGISQLPFIKQWVQSQEEKQDVENEIQRCLNYLRKLPVGAITERQHWEQELAQHQALLSNLSKPFQFPLFPISF